MLIQPPTILTQTVCFKTVGHLKYTLEQHAKKGFLSANGELLDIEED